MRRCPQCAEEIQAEAKARLEDAERVAPAPTLGQPVAAEEDVSRLRKPAMRRVIDVLEFVGEGRAVIRSGQRGRGD